MISHPSNGTRTNAGEGLRMFGSQAPVFSISFLCEELNLLCVEGFLENTTITVVRREPKVPRGLFMTNSRRRSIGCGQLPEFDVGG